MQAAELELSDDAGSTEAPSERRSAGPKGSHPAGLTHARNRGNAEGYEAAVRRYAAGGDEADLWDDLAALGVDRDEILWRVDRPGRRMEQVYA